MSSKEKDMFVKGIRDGCLFPRKLLYSLDHKKAECRRMDAFELWCWGRLMRVPWTARRLYIYTHTHTYIHTYIDDIYIWYIYKKHDLYIHDIYIYTHIYIIYTHTYILSHFSCDGLFVTPWTIAHQAPLSMDSPGKNTGVGCHDRIFQAQGSNPHFLSLMHWQAASLSLSHQGNHA